MNIDHLPPELLKIVLSNSKITLPQCITLRAVSSYWQATIEEHVLKSTTELVLSHNVTCSNRLPFKVECIPTLARLFPALANLTVSYDAQMYQPLPQLLSAFTSTLTTLKLYHCYRSYIHDRKWISDLIRALNSLTALTRLDMEYPPDISKILPHLLPTLAHLQQFEYSIHDENASERCTPWQIITDNQPLMTMTHLRLSPQTSSEYNVAVADIVATFPSLQSLDLGFLLREPCGCRQTVNLSDILRSLSSLEHLSKLTLWPLFSSTFHLAMPSPTDRPLTQMKKLDLSFESRIDDAELFTSALLAWFPSLDRLILYWRWGFSLTTTTLHNLALLQDVTDFEFINKKEFNLGVELLEPTGRPLTILKELHLTVDGDYPTEELCSAALAAWFPCLEKLTINSNNRRIDLTTAILRDFSRLEHLSELNLVEFDFERCQLSLPSSDDRQLIKLKKLDLNMILEPADSPDGKHLCAALAAWCVSLEQLNIVCSVESEVGFHPSLNMLGEFATLEHLTELNLSEMDYDPQRFTMPTAADQVLTHVKKLNIKFGYPYSFCDFATGEQHIISVLAGWFPCLEKLTVDIYYDGEDLEAYPYKFYLTSNMLRDLARLQYLVELELPVMLYTKKYLDVPCATDQPMTLLKELSLEIEDLAEEFDGQYCCSTVAAWFIGLEEVTISAAPKYDESMDAFYVYKYAVTDNGHYFGDSVKVNTSLYRAF